MRLRPRDWLGDHADLVQLDAEARGRTEGEHEQPGQQEPAAQDRGVPGASIVGATERQRATTLPPDGAPPPSSPDATDPWFGVARLIPGSARDPLRRRTRTRRRPGARRVAIRAAQSPASPPSPWADQPAPSPPGPRVEHPPPAPPSPHANHHAQADQPPAAAPDPWPREPPAIPSAQSFWSASSPLLHTPIQGPPGAPASANTPTDARPAQPDGQTDCPRPLERLSHKFGRLSRPVRQLSHTSVSRRFALPSVARARGAVTATGLVLLAVLGIIGLLHRGAAVAGHRAASTRATRHLSTRGSSSETGRTLSTGAQSLSALPSVDQALAALGAGASRSTQSSATDRTGRPRTSRRGRIATRQGSARRTRYAGALARSKDQAMHASPHTSGPTPTAGSSPPEGDAESSNSAAYASSPASYDGLANTSSAAPRSGSAASGESPGGHQTSLGPSSPARSAAASTASGPVGPGAPFGPGYAN